MFLCTLDRYWPQCLGRPRSQAHDDDLIRGCVAVAFVFPLMLTSAGGAGRQYLLVPCYPRRRLFTSMSQSHGSHSTVALMRVRLAKRPKRWRTGSLCLHSSLFPRSACFPVGKSPVRFTLTPLPASALSAVYGLSGAGDHEQQRWPRFGHQQNKGADDARSGLVAGTRRWLAAELPVIASVERRAERRNLEPAGKILSGRASWTPQIFVPRTRFVLEHWNNVEHGRAGRSARSRAGRLAQLDSAARNPDAAQADYQPRRAARESPWRLQSSLPFLASLADKHRVTESLLPSRSRASRFA